MKIITWSDAPQDEELYKRVAALGREPLIKAPMYGPLYECVLLFLLGKGIRVGSAGSTVFVCLFVSVFNWVSLFHSP